MSVNKILLIGNVGKSPEVKKTDNGTIVVKFPLATNEKYKNKQGEKVERTEWHNLVFFGKIAEIAEKYVKMGNEIYVEGSIHYGQYEKDGQTKYFTNIIVKTLQLLGGKGSKQQDTPEPVPQAQASNEPQMMQGEPKSAPDDDLPF